MKINNFTKILVLLLCFNSLLIGQKNKGGSRIIGGDLAGSNPGYVVSIHIPTFGFVGTGVILDSKTILTAAHVADNHASFCQHCLKIRVGSNNIDFSTQEVQSLAIKLHPDFPDILPNSVDPVGHDLALIKLTEDIIFDDNVKPIEIARSCIFDDSDFSFGTGTTIYGWGATSTGNSTMNSSLLRKTDQSIINIYNSQFWLGEPYYEEHYENNSMFASYSSESQVYSGDSGGPCVMTKDGTDYLIGIVSWGRDPNLSNNSNILYPGIMANVYKMREWILDNLSAGGYSCSQDGPILDMNSVIISCSDATVDLSPLIGEDIPSGLEVRWSTDDEPIDCVSPAYTDFVTQSGTYYAYFYDAALDCYSQPSEPVAVSLGCTSENNLLVTSDMIISTDEAYNKIEVKGGATLTITANATIKMTDKILVEAGSKLIVDGGVLTNCPTCPKWQGIIIAGLDNTGPGFAQGGEVEIRNEGTIEYAEIGVKKHNSILGNGPGGWQSLTNANVGKLTMTTGARIRNCAVGVELNSTGGSTFGASGQEISTIDNSFFEENHIGVRLKGNRGLIIRESTFTPGSNFLTFTIGVEVISSFVDILNNNFVSLAAGVFINASYPALLGTNIIGNNFQSDLTFQNLVSGFSVFNESLNNAEYLNIQNNTMIYNDIYNLGLSTFIIRRNDLLHGYHAIT